MLVNFDVLHAFALRFRNLAKETLVFCNARTQRKMPLRVALIVPYVQFDMFRLTVRYRAESVVDIHSRCLGWIS